MSTASDYVSETAKLELETAMLETAAVPPPLRLVRDHSP
jgi:hypothetical protein